MAGYQFSILEKNLQNKKLFDWGFFVNAIAPEAALCAKTEWRPETPT